MGYLKREGEAGELRWVIYRRGGRGQGTKIGYLWRRERPWN